jgi:hypothetical protein
MELVILVVQRVAEAQEAKAWRRWKYAFVP